VLLSTLPGEQHGLGLLMAEAACALEGAECVSLGVQTPVAELAAAALAKRADVVAVSFSANFPATGLQEAVKSLRAALPTGVELWCGGAGAARLKRPPAAVRVFQELAAIGTALADWRAGHAAET
jgi:methylmalonyl-CoA mutase cobalamin-binding subunit